MENPTVDYTALALLTRRYMKVKQAGWFDGVILADCGVLYWTDTAYDMWENRKRISVDRFRELVEEAEKLYAATETRISAGREGALVGTGDTAGRKKSNQRDEAGFDYQRRKAG